MLRFTIRDVLWLTVVAAAVTGWGIDRVRFQKRIEQTASHLKMEVERARAEAAAQRAMAFMMSARLQQMQPQSQAQRPPEILVQPGQ